MAYPAKQPNESVQDWLNRITMHNNSNTLKPLSSKRLAEEPNSPAPPSKRAKTASMPVSSSRSGNANSNADIKDKLTSVVTVTTRGKLDKAVKTVTLHVGMLAQKAPPLYRQALTSLDIKALELDSEAFAIFAAWLYSGNIEFDTESDAGDILSSVLECYCLALTLQSSEFAKSILTQACTISAKHGLVFRNLIINETYKRTPPTCGLRRWIVDEWVWQYDSESVADLDWEGNCDLCNGFLFDVMVAQAKRIGERAKVRYSLLLEEHRLLMGF